MSSTIVPSSTMTSSSMMESSSTMVPSSTMTSSSIIESSSTMASSSIIKASSNASPEIDQENDIFYDAPDDHTWRYVGVSIGGVSVLTLGAGLTIAVIYHGKSKTRSLDISPVVMSNLHEKA